MIDNKDIDLESFVKYLTTRQNYYFIKFGQIERKLDIDLNNGLTYYLSSKYMGIEFYIMMRYGEDQHEYNALNVDNFAKAVKGDNDLSDKFLVAIKKALSELEGVNKIKNV